MCPQGSGWPTQGTARGRTSQDSNQDPVSAHQDPSLGTQGSSKEQSREPTARRLPFPRAPCRSSPPGHRRAGGSGRLGPASARCSGGRCSDCPARLQRSRKCHGCDLRLPGCHQGALGKGGPLPLRPQALIGPRFWLASGSGGRLSPLTFSSGCRDHPIRQ